MTYVDSLSAHGAPQRTATSGAVTHRLPHQRLVFGLIAFVLGGTVAASAVATDLRTLSDLRELLPPGHYLVLLQNNAEQRPSGGFLGTFATVDLTSTGYTNLRVDTNIYKRDTAFTEQHAIEPPEPLWGVAAGNRWAMRDSNWDLDFRDAALRVSWFCAQEGGEPVDGVIALNATVLQDLLKLTGPIPLPTGEEELTAENFFDTLHYKIEKEYFYDPGNRTRNEPKTILRELIPGIQRRILWPSVAPKVVSLVEQELVERHIQLYHTDPAVELEILERGWGGGVTQTDADFLLVNNASVGGRKSSLKVVQVLDLDVTTGGGRQRHALTIQRTHTGDGVWPDHTNNNYVRVAVPADATLVAVERGGESVLREVTTSFEAGKTVFGVHLDTDPGTTSQLELVYTTAMRAPYALQYQKQSGTLQDGLRVRLDGTILIDRVVTTDQYIEKQ